MGIYIKNMEMPTSCWECPCHGGDEHGEFVCNPLARELICYPEKERFDDCPLVPVPEGVDLIDREALMDDIISSMVFSGRNVPKEAAIVQKVLDIIGDAKAVIPAEEGDAE